MTGASGGSFPVVFMTVINCQVPQLLSRFDSLTELFKFQAVLIFAHRATAYVPEVVNMYEPETRGLNDSFVARKEITGLAATRTKDVVAMCTVWFSLVVICVEDDDCGTSFTILNVFGNPGVLEASLLILEIVPENDTVCPTVAEEGETVVVLAIRSGRGFQSSGTGSGIGGNIAALAWSGKDATVIHTMSRRIFFIRRE